MTTTPAKTTHILKLARGWKVQLALREDTCQALLEWTHGTSQRLTRRELAKYQEWRNTVLAEWSERMGRSVIVVEV